MMLTRFEDEPDAAGVNIYDIPGNVRHYMTTVADQCGILFPVFTDNTQCIFFVKDLDYILSKYEDLETFFSDNVEEASTFLFYNYSNPFRDENNERSQVLEVFLGACDNNVYEVLRLLKTLVESSSSSYVWTAVSPDLTSNVLTVISQYLSNNQFSTPKLSSTTINGSVLSKPMITFILDKLNLNMEKESISKTIEYVLQLKERILPEKLDSCTYTVFIPPETLIRARQEFIEKDKEYAGLFLITGYSVVEDKNRKPSVLATLKMPDKEIVRGQTLSVVPPVGLFNFHTHPIVTYTTNHLALNAPSASDLLAVPYIRLTDTVLHMVISVEGVYTVQLTPEFQRYIDYMNSFDQTNLHACRQTLFEELKKHVATFEAFSQTKGNADGKLVYYYGGDKDMNRFFYGGLDNLTVRDVDLIKQYLYNANNITIQTVIRNNSNPRCSWLNSEVDFKLYVVSFTPWIEISYRGITVDVTTVSRGKLQCPPSITRELNKFENSRIV